MGEDRKRWEVLCEQATTEADPTEVDGTHPRNKW